MGKKPKKKAKRKARTQNVAIYDSPVLDEMYNGTPAAYLMPDDRVREIADGMIRGIDPFGNRLDAGARGRIDREYRSRMAAMRPLVAAYVKALQDRGIVWTADEIERANRIVFPELTDDAVTDVIREASDVLSKTEGGAVWLSVPCFAKGVLDMRAQGRDLVAWELKGLDVERRSMTLDLGHYIHEPELGTFVPNVQLRGVTVAVTPDGTAYTADCSAGRSMPISVLYSMLSARNLGWTDADYGRYDEIVLGTARRFERTVGKRGAVPSDERLVQVFMAGISMANAFLTKAPARKTGRPSPAAREVRLMPKEQGEERVIRASGPLKIISDRPPRKINDVRSIVRYVTASWETRGHVRRYRSGKTVYVRPSVHHRKALAEAAAGGTLPRTTIAIAPGRKGRGKEEGTDG